MSFSDDYASPKAPFSGDESGEIFDTPDLVLQSPTTTERIVDTQSGFLVVVRQIGARQALSVKRRLGTPPVSSILFTPDESLQLSKILSNSQNEPESRTATGVSANVDDWHNRFSPDAVEKEVVAKVTPQQQIPEHSGLFARLGEKIPGQRPVILIAVVVLALTSGIFLSNHWRQLRQHKIAQSQQTTALEKKAASFAQIDQFVRNYVSNLLDFNPQSYRFSQIQAMSVMTPELMAKYWKETNFPIAQAQLRSTLKRETLVITKVVQQESNEDNLSNKDQLRTVDVFAQLNGADGQSSTPTHLQLKIETPPGQAIRVLEQKDITASKQ